MFLRIWTVPLGCKGRTLLTYKARESLCCCTLGDTQKTFKAKTLSASAEHKCWIIHLNIGKIYLKFCMGCKCRQWQQLCCLWGESWASPRWAQLFPEVSNPPTKGCSWAMQPRGWQLWERVFKKGQHATQDSTEWQIKNYSEKHPCRYPGQNRTRGGGTLWAVQRLPCWPQCRQPVHQQSM